MLRRILICSGLLLTSYASAARLQSQNTATPANAVTNRGLLDEYCVTWHNAANSKGRTALHGAAGIGANAIIQFLVEKGANLNRKDRDGYTPLAVAAGRAPRGGDSASRVYEDTMALLIKLGAQPLVSPR